MTKDNQKKGNGFFSLKFCFLFLMFLFLFVIPINAETFGYGDSGKKFGYDTNLPSTGGGNTTINQNITNIYQNVTQNITNNITTQAANYSILSFKANITDFPVNLSQFFNDLNLGLLYYSISNPLHFINTSDSIFNYFTNGTFLTQGLADTLYYPKYNNIANYYNSSNFNITSFYNSSNPSNFYNSSNFNISTFYNSSNPFNFWNDSKIYNGTICLLNGTGCPASSGITNGSSAWLQNLSVAGDFLVDNGLIFANSTSNFVGIGTTSPKTTLSILPNNLSLFNTPFLFSGASNNNWSNISDIELGFNSYQNATDFSFISNGSYSAWYQEFRIGNGTVTDDNNFWSLNFLSENRTANITPLYVNGLGRVGINTTTPQNTLNVIGDINTTGKISADSTAQRNFTLSQLSSSGGTFSTIWNIALLPNKYYSINCQWSENGGQPGGVAWFANATGVVTGAGLISQTFQLMNSTSLLSSNNTVSSNLHYYNISTLSTEAVDSYQAFFNTTGQSNSRLIIQMKSITGGTITRVQAGAYCDVVRSS